MFLQEGMSQLIQPLKVSSQVSFALFCEKLKRLRLGYCQGMTLVAAVFAANEDAESEERRTPNLQQIRRMVGTSLVGRKAYHRFAVFVQRVRGLWL